VTSVLLVSGSTRSLSTNTAALRTIEMLSQERGIRTVSYEGLASLPAFNPDDDDARLPPEPRALRAAIAAADAVLFCTPEYAGTLPGSLKNLLDWTVGGSEMDAKPVAWLNVAAPGRGGGAIATLEVVLGYVNARVLSEACREVPVGRDDLTADGLVAAGPTRDALGAALDAIVTRLG
jgi:NAD(P)H-dependent FMN reductase